MKKQTARIKNLPTRKIKNTINDLTYQISKLRVDIDTSEELNEKYNRMLIERACLRKKCLNMQSNNVVSILLKKFNIKRDPKSICDYFESN
jgi:hypothetical protein